MLYWLRKSSLLSYLPLEEEKTLVILMMNLPLKHLSSLHLENQGYFQKKSRKCSEILITLLIGVNFHTLWSPSWLAHKNASLKNTDPSIAFCATCSFWVFLNHMKILLSTVFTLFWRVASLYIVFYLSTGKQVYGVPKLSWWTRAVLNFPHVGARGSVQFPSLFHSR